MKGDYTRFTFEPGKHYDAVLMQQGRVQTDADWNEQVMIAAHRDRTRALDIIGPAGAPQDVGAGALGNFVVYHGPDAQGAYRLFINGGRYYVDGLMVESEAPVMFTDQPGAVLPPAEGAGTYLLYLDVWRRHLTALEDPGIREVALGGVDTGTRTQLAWQARLERIGDLGVNLATFPASQVGPGWRPAGAASTGAMDAQAGSSPLENLLYRVEIHRGGTSEQATFKWSRDNGAVVAGILTHSTPVLSEGAFRLSVTTDRAARDAFSGFLPGHWVELSSEELLLQRRPGLFFKVAAVDGDTLSLLRAWSGPAPDALQSDSPDVNPLLGTGRTVRRWDNLWCPDTDDGRLAPGAPESQRNGRTLLERDITVTFAQHAPDGQPAVYQAGDYWLIPARNVSGLEGWEPGRAQPPAGEQYAYAALALVKVQADGAILDPSHDLRDLRDVFPTLRSLTSGTGSIVQGTGSLNRVPRWQSEGGSVLVNSCIADTGSAVAVQGSLSVDGALRVGTSGGAAAISMFTSAHVWSMSPAEAQAAVPTAQGVKDLVDRAVPPGTVMAYAGENAPDGWLECDGASLDGAEGGPFRDLFLAIGKAFGGGNGSPAGFNLPDLRGRFIRGWNHGAGADPDAGSRSASAPGGHTSDGVGSYQADQHGSHGHSFSGSVTVDPTNTDHTHDARRFSSVDGQPWPGTWNTWYGITWDNTTGMSQNAIHAHSATVSGSVGESGGSETRPKNVYLMYIIKY